MPDATAARTWAAVLDEFAAVLDRNEQRLAAQAWEAFETPSAASDVPAGEPSTADRARAAALLARAGDQERRLRAEHDATSAELGELAQRRHAARRYTA